MSPGYADAERSFCLFIKQCLFPVRSTSAVASVFTVTLLKSKRFVHFDWISLKQPVLTSHVCQLATAGEQRDCGGPQLGSTLNQMSNSCKYSRADSGSMGLAAESKQLQDGGLHIDRTPCDLASVWPQGKENWQKERPQPMLVWGNMCLPASLWS